MRILLDECAPWPLHRLLTSHECLTVQACGWAGIQNGKLLELAETRFDIFITTDQNLRYQQNLRSRRIAIIELSTNKLRRIANSAAMIREAIDLIKPGEYLRLEIP
jgi:hypothetical protein